MVLQEVCALHPPCVFTIIVEAQSTFLAALVSGASGVGTQDVAHGMPPALRHCYVTTQRRHAVDTVRKAIHALGAERVLIFMNFQHRLKASFWTLQQH